MISVLTIFLGLISWIFFKFIIIPLVLSIPYLRKGGTFYLFPLIGQVFWNRDDLKKYGDCYHFEKNFRRTHPNSRFIVSNIGSSPFITLVDTKLVKAFFQHHECYHRKKDFMGFLQKLFGRGMITSDGSLHKARRKVISKVFHFDFLVNMIPDIIAVTKERFDEMEKGDLNHTQLLYEFEKITGEITGRLFFHEHLNKHTFRGKPLTIALNEMLVKVFRVGLNATYYLLGETLFHKLGLDTYFGIKQDIEEFRELCKKIVREKKAAFLQKKAQGIEISKKDMLDNLFSKMGTEEEKELELSDEDIVDEFITFFLAGMETTAHWATLAAYHISKNKAYQDRSREEVNTYYKDGNEVTLENLQKMDFSYALLKEVLRIATPSPALFPRVVIQDHYLNDVFVKKGTLVTVGIIANSHNEAHFEDPDCFIPERWLKTPQPSDTYAYIPFSSGYRNCIGQHLAQIEARVLVSELLSRYNVTLKEPQELRMTIKGMYEPAENIYFSLKKH